VRQAIRLVDDSGSEALNHLRVDFANHRVGKRRNASDRSLQFMAEIGHKVSAHAVDSCAFGDILNGCDDVSGYKSLGPDVE